MCSWVHCNVCNVLPSNAVAKFHLSSCGHILCQKCVNNASNRKCGVCSQECSFMEINRQMKPDVQMFFSDPADVAKKYHKHLLQIIEFQKIQNGRMNSLCKSQQKKTQKMLDYFQQEMKKKQEISKELAACKEQCRQLMQMVHSNKQSIQHVNSAYRVPYTPGTVATKKSNETPMFFGNRAQTPATVCNNMSSLRLRPQTAMDHGSANGMAPRSGGLTTPVMLGLDKRNKGRTPNSGNPYEISRPANCTPMTISPSVGLTGNPLVQIKIPFRMNPNQLLR